MMVEFVNISAKDRIDVMLGVIRLAELKMWPGCEWTLDWFNNNELLRSDEMRQIAGKLDELNGVKLPEFLKEQS